MATVYRRRTRPAQTERTRAKIMDAVRELLTEGTFHESTVEQVAERAGVSRATLYSHFDSRLQLVDAICDTFGVNPALVELRRAVERGDLPQVVALAVRFWSSEDAVLGQLYGAVAVDDAAKDLVRRQREDRRHELEQLIRRTGGGQRTLSLLMVLTSYAAYRELKDLGFSDTRVTKTLQDAAAILAGPGRS